MRRRAPGRGALAQAQQAFGGPGPPRATLQRSPPTTRGSAGRARAASNAAPPAPVLPRPCWTRFASAPRVSRPPACRAGAVICWLAARRPPAGGSTTVQRLQPARAAATPSVGAPHASSAGGESALSCRGLVVARGAVAVRGSFVSTGASVRGCATLFFCEGQEAAGWL